MKRRIGSVLLVTFVVFAAWWLTPSSRAGGSGKSSGTNTQAGETSTRVGKGQRGLQRGHVGPETVGLPSTLDERAPMSAAVGTFVGGRNGLFNDVTLLGNFDGREDYAADRAAKFDDLTGLFQDPDSTVTRMGISEHTFANGFNENVIYYGDSVGNLIAGVDTNPSINPGPVASIDTLTQVNIPSLINTGASGGFSITPGAFGCTDDEVAVTGIAVSPVVDLSDFGQPCGTIGEVVYVSILDTGACSANAANQPIRTRILAFAFTDAVGGVAPAGVLQSFSSPLSNTGVAVDDDGSLYFHLVDLVQFTGGAIFKAAENAHIAPPAAGCPANPRVNRAIVAVPTVSLTSVTPLSSASVRVTNFSSANSPGAAGQITTGFGNIVGIAAGPGNVIYAAVARSASSGDPTEGPFTNPAALGATPSMIISFADTSGAFDSCSGATNLPGINLGGNIPIGDGFADGPAVGVARVVGVNNFRVFALGNGPDIRPVAPATSPIVTASTLKLDMQVDWSAYSGITVDEEGTVYAISGGAPSGLGADPSPARGEILAFQDQCPADRRADFIDFRADSVAGNVGDGDSDRFDHVYWQAPNDATGNPSGVSGLTHGFLRYTNRLAPNAISPGVTLGQTAGQTVQGDDTTTGPILFDGFDPSSQVAGGDDAAAPNRGDDADGNPNPVIANNPVVAAPGGGFEFTFAVSGGTNGVWNAFFLNSNGNLTFGDGDTDNTPSTTELYAGLPRIAPVWSDLNPSSRAVDVRTFPVQALGFAAVNAFKVRYINVPLFAAETCSGDGNGRSNTIAATLYDDGTGADENSAGGSEGPTDLRFSRETVTGTLVGSAARPDGTGYFVFDYARNDIIGTSGEPVITGYSGGGGVGSNPPGLCESNLSEAARAAENGTFGVIQGQTASIASCLIGEGTEPALFEEFNQGEGAQVSGAGTFTFALIDDDLRNEGNNAVLSTPLTQTDVNRGRVGFAGFALPPVPVISAVIPGPFVVAPNQPNNLINALGPVDLFVVGSGFFPNETTTVCQGFPPDGFIPLERPGKNVSTAMTLGIDNNGDAVVDVTIALTNVTPMGPNLVKGTLATVTGLPGTAFPLTAIGPDGIVTVTSTFSAADNNGFGAFTRAATAPLNVGNRAPVVLSATSPTSDCASPKVVNLTGAGFLLGDGVTPNVTSVTAVSGGTVVTATSFTILDSNNLTATFTFPSGGGTFFIFADGPNGTSRNMSVLPAGTPPGVPTGNEAGNQISISCSDSFQFSTSLVNVTESCVTELITVTRTNAMPTSATVDFATVDGSAVQVADYEIALGTLTFAPGETSKTIPLLINEDSFSEPPETLTIQLSNPTGGVILGTQSTTTVVIADNDPVGSLTPAPKFFVAALDGAHEVPSNASTAKGQAIVILDAAETSAQVSLLFTGLSSPQLSVAPGGAHIHGPAAPGANAPIVFSLSPPQPNGPINNFTIMLTPTQVQQLKDGLFYVNVHTTNFPGGEIRGQLLFNAIEDPETFVCQQYHDFLNRDPDPAGMTFWIDRINSCGADVGCITRARTAVAAAFFFSNEFQETGFFAIRVYRVAFDTNAASRPTYLEFMRDRSVLMGGGNLDAQKAAYTEEFVTRPEFVAAYPAGLTPAQYVDALNANTGNSLTTAERDALVAGLTNATETRATVLKAIADNAVFRAKEFNPAFVAMEYMGELRRAPELSGFNFWLAQLMANNNNQAMVCSFITSAEYQLRFGPNVTRSNAECVGVGP